MLLYAGVLASILIGIGTGSLQVALGVLILTIGMWSALDDINERLRK